MKYVVTHGGTEYELELLAREDGGFDVVMGDSTYRADLEATGDDGIYSLLLDGISYELLMVADGQRATVIHHAVGADLLVESERERNARAIAGGPEEGTGDQIVTAVMPGIVVSVAVDVGDAVEPGTAVCVLEAMKMENEIRTNGGGIISRVFVEAGQTVNGGDPLVEIEPS